MTPDELREIDARIAALMGWRQMTVRYPEEGGWTFDTYVDAEGVGRARVDEFRPTTDPKSATMLWDKLREDHTVCVQSRAAYFRVTIFSWTRLLAKSKEETFGLALCKAALAMAEAKGATV